MIKIIKKGTPLEEEIFRHECQYCHTIYDFSRNEAKYNEDYRESWLTISCPICHKVNYKEL
jgi:hypothetical protein